MLTVSRWRQAWIPISLLMVLSLAWQAVQTAPKVDASKDQRAESFGRMVMQTLPKNALVFTKDDETTFTLWYFHYGLKQRADIAVIVEGLLKYDWYLQTLKTAYPDLKIPPTGDISITSLALSNPSRTNCSIKDHLTINNLCSSE